MNKFIIEAEQVNIKMPRPANPKPGFSLLRIHSSQKPHNIANLSTKAKAELINSIAQDIEGCIWAIGHYSKLGVLDSTHTLGFDQVINDIHNDERHENKEVLQRTLRKLERYKKRAKAQKKRCKRLEAKLQKERAKHTEEGSNDSDTSTIYSEMASMQTTFSTRDGKSNEAFRSAINGGDGTGQALQGTAPIQSVESPDEPMTSPPPAFPSPPRRSMEVDYEKTVHFQLPYEEQTWQSILP
ncbi:uncharacterized protein BHQ10_002553 [Talaromyces amestolkiae]|uniref:Uncharacterized protein n=1 Tax=Talaromyces amestolkiae TaxID=1196081 RepID=A0A364KSR0_TALAM|nr:uncharacterized protein BHQ10_002553 [Talaromyces amestolkiae]RAO66541.1 hypothetical protein BHQ10_002553 [Talaromyces amestolkiae]